MAIQTVYSGLNPYKCSFYITHSFMRYLYFQPLLASQKALLASNKSFEASTQTTSLENELPQRSKVNLNKRLETKTKGYHIMKGDTNQTKFLYWAKLVFRVTRLQLTLI